MKVFGICAAILMTIAASAIEADIAHYDINDQQLLSSLTTASAGLDHVDLSSLSGIISADGTPQGGWLNFGSTKTHLYGIDGTGLLYSIDPQNWMVSVVGSLGLGLSGTVGLSTGSTTLYFTEKGNLYKINTLTGAASLVGLVGNRGNYAPAFNDVVYGGGGTPSFSGPNTSSFFEPNTDTSTDTTTDGALGGDFGPRAFARIPASLAPEPSFLVVLGMIFVAIGWAAFRRGKATV